MLTDTACKNAKPRDKAYKLSDEKGLYLEAMPTGAKYWRLKYRHGGKEKRLAFGVYPDVTLKDARE
ncbi:MAG: Arm DNA-binding domain-containing protein, partial [Candidatus Methylumidiphilus sp.]